MQLLQARRSSARQLIFAHGLLTIRRLNKTSGGSSSLYIVKYYHNTVKYYTLNIYLLIDIIVVGSLGSAQASSIGEGQGVNS